MDLFNNINDLIVRIIESLDIYGPLLACALITIESMLPMLPLCVFITINFIAFGSFLGFVISWFFTVLGCMISYYIFKKGFNSRFRKYLKSNKVALENMMVKIDNFSLGQLVVLLAIPFTPAFLVNIAAGLSDIKPKKYLYSLCIGKISLVYFWGYIGVSFIESLRTDSLMLGQFKMAQLISIVLFIIGFILVIRGKEKYNKEDM